MINLNICYLKLLGTMPTEAVEYPGPEWESHQPATRLAIYSALHTLGNTTL